MNGEQIVDEERVDAAIADYMDRIDKGESVDRDEFIAGHSDIADSLREYFTAADTIDRLAGPTIAEVSTPPQKKKPAPNETRDTIRGSQVEDSVAEKITNKSESIPKEFGRYRIVKALGQGAMGAVYLAEDTQLERQIALKIPKFSENDGPEILERFYREARAAANLHNPNICPVYDVGEIDGMHFITMGYIKGRPLSDFIKPDKQQPARQIANLVRKLALALEEAHAKGVVHRDLKPANVMVDQKQQPVIMDFGLARQLNKNEDQRLTQDGMIIGSPAYMSPEQVQGSIDEMGTCCDIYSLGVILYEMLTGQLPFQGPIAAVIGQIVMKDPTKPSELRPDLDSSLETICLKMMSKQITDRHASMKEVAADLAAYLKETGKKPTTGSTISPRDDDQALAAMFAAQQSMPLASVKQPKPKATSKPKLTAKPKRIRKKSGGDRVITKVGDAWQKVPPVARLITASAVAGLLMAWGIVILFRSDTMTVKVEIDEQLVANGSVTLKIAGAK